MKALKYSLVLLGTLVSLFAAAQSSETESVSPAAEDQQYLEPVRPSTQEPAFHPPPPPPIADIQSPLDVPAQPTVPTAPSDGQWVCTAQYGWIWMPYWDNCLYIPPSDSIPVMYVYDYSYGWCWLLAPWVWGLGPMPNFGTYGTNCYNWFGNGYGHWYRWGAISHENHHWNMRGMYLHGRWTGVGPNHHANGNSRPLIRQGITHLQPRAAQGNFTHGVTQPHFTNGSARGPVTVAPQQHRVISVPRSNGSYNNHRR